MLCVQLNPEIFSNSAKIASLPDTLLWNILYADDIVDL
nr:MAG TPA: hypothetical protein [Caudoviricetes sp.]DAV60155.1 MAG TPA: hypothetical protein [Caudoviricetes sp.]